MRYPHVFAAQRQATRSVASSWNAFHAYALLRHSAVVDSFIASPKVDGRRKSRFRDNRVQKNNQKRIKALNPNVGIPFPYSAPQAHLNDTPPPFWQRHLD
jgi:hypothetical protein